MTRLASRVLAALVVTGFLVAPGFTAAQDDEMRTWTDSTGKFKIEAKFQSVSGGTVTLLQEDGSELEIELAKLSAADRKLVNELAAGGGNPFKGKAANPFAAKSPATKAAKPGMKKPAEEEAEEPAAKRKLEELDSDWGDVKDVSMTPDKEKWEFTPTPAPESPKIVTKPIGLPKKSNFFEGAKGIAVCPTQPVAVVGYVIAPPGDNGQTRLVSVDLSTGKTPANATVSGKYVPLALHPNGNTVVVREDGFGHNNQSVVEIWKLGSKIITRQARWTPYPAGKNGKSPDVPWAQYLDDGRLLTLSSEGLLVLWEPDTAKAVWQLQLLGGSSPGLTADRKMLAFAGDKQIGVLDVERGEVLATAPAGVLHWAQMAVNPGSTKIACTLIDRVIVWDFATGEQVRDINVMNLHHHAIASFWADDDFLVVGNRYLVDVANQIKFWDYNGAEFAAKAGDRTLFALASGQNQPGTLLPAKLPHQAAKDYLARALKDPNLFVLKEGTAVKVDTNGIQDAAQKAAVQKTLTDRLSQMGFRPSDQGTITLVATTETGKQEEIRYRSFFDPPFAGKTYQLQTYITKLAFMYEGKPAWETSGNNVPGFIHLKEDETIASVLKSHEKPNYKFFETIELPKLLTKPTGKPTLGSSQLIPTGIQ